MDSPIIETPLRRPTAIPRLNKKSSFDSGLTCSGDIHQEENALSRCSSDPNQHPGRCSDKTKKLGKFTMKETVNVSKSDEVTIPANSETDDEINSTIFSGRIEEKNGRSDVLQESHPVRNGLESNGVDSVEDDAITVMEGMKFSPQYNKTDVSLDSTGQSSASTNRTLTPAFIESSCQTVPPLQLQNLQNTAAGEQMLRNRLAARALNVQTQKNPKQSLKEAYLKQMEFSKVDQNQTFNQCKWNAINPLYKNVTLKENILDNSSKLTARLVSDIDVENLTKKEDSSEIESDDEESTAHASQTNTGLYKLYKALAKSKEKEAILNQTLENKRESLVNAFLEVFGNDSHIIQKLRNNTFAKNDDRFRRLKSDCQQQQEMKNDIPTIQEHPSEFNNSKLIRDIYRNADVYSVMSQTSNEAWSCPCTPKRFAGSKSSRTRSNASMKGCGCEMNHLQLNDVQKSITDIRNGMKMMLCSLSPTSNEEIAFELTRLRTLYNECLTYQRKLIMQNKRLQNDMQGLCSTVRKALDKKKSSSSLKYFFMLPILGIIGYFIAAHFDICKKIPFTCEETI
ncbi:hypothetical protein Trydic_g334 [Trypoxylus dichotomus]